MNKTKAEKQIERMWYLEHKVSRSTEEILKCCYTQNDWSIKPIAEYFIQSYGTIQALLKKYNINKELIFVD